MPQAALQIQVTTGAIDCADAYGIAAQYDLQGEKIQQIGSFRCYEGNSATRPIVFTCVSNDAEFAVSGA